MNAATKQGEPVGASLQCIEGELWDACALLSALCARIAEMEIHETDGLAVGIDAAAELRCLCRVTSGIIERQALTLAAGGLQ